MSTVATNPFGVPRTRRGPTLAETAVILAVLAVLTLILVPTINSHIAIGRILRTKQDVRLIGKAITRFHRDLGFAPLAIDSVAGKQGYQRVDMLVGPGETPSVFDNPNARGVKPWTYGTSDQLAHQLVDNSPRYRRAGDRNSLGWNGPYLDPPVTADPWGNRYMVNIAFFDIGSGTLDDSGNPRRAVYILSAGPNRKVETPFDQPITSASIWGDDISYRLQ